MDDRELIEKAAKAAGIELSPFQCREADSLYLPNSEHWNPLTDSAQALELAVKLGLDVAFMGAFKEDPQHELSTHVSHPLAFGGWFEEDHGHVPMAATRRAIVRAAAGLWDGRKT